MLRTGVDMVEIDRIRRAAARHGERFYRRFYTERERAHCAGRFSALAVRFAAKEAVAKALGTGIGDVSWKEIEIRVDNPRKRPTLHLHGAAADLSRELGITQWDVSLTHTEVYASALAVGL